MSIDDDDYMDEIDTDEDIDTITFACEDCDHRWEPDDLDEMICPMCGSENVVEL
jgi:Zn finger protein HypA/HybF involved in hydrogenase expression